MIAGEQIEKRYTHLLLMALIKFIYAAEDILEAFLEISPKSEYFWSFKDLLIILESDIEAYDREVMQ